MKQKNIFRRYRPRYLGSAKSGKGKIAVLAVALSLLSVLSAVTVAFLLDRDEAVNTFTPAFVACEVQETFENNIKTDVTVKNTGNASAYIRAIVVANWVGDTGTENAGKVYYQEPSAGTDYSINYGADWHLHTDGYYYYAQPVDVAGSTGNLIDSCAALLPAPVAGYHLEVEVAAEAVQSEGTDDSGTKAVLLAWGVDPEALN